jgi:hypothetical protein
LAPALARFPLVAFAFDPLTFALRLLTFAFDPLTFALRLLTFAFDPLTFAVHGRAFARGVDRSCHWGRRGGAPARPAWARRRRRGAGERGADRGHLASGRLL